MPIKKSGVLLMLLTCSVSLLVFSATTKSATEIAPVLSEKCNPGESCTQAPAPKPMSAWDMISQIMWRYEA